MRVGDLINDGDSMALLVGKHKDKYTLYYLTGDVAGDLVSEYAAQVKRFFSVISHREDGKAARENFVGVIA